MGKAGNIRLENNGWTADFYQPEEGVLNLVWDTGDHALKCHGVSLGEEGEEQAYLKKCRRHDSQDGDLVQVESEVVMPSGPEPRVRRRWDFFANVVKVTVDFDLRKAYAASQLEIDRLQLTGDWQRVGIFSFDRESAEVQVEWYDLASGKVSLEMPSVPLLWLFEAKDGRRCEIGTGFDLWRWDFAAKSGWTAAYALQVDETGITLIRRVLELPGDSEIPPRNWRFNWYFSWDDGMAAEVSAPGDHQIIPEPGLPLAVDLSAGNVFQLDASAWPDSAKRLSSRDGDFLCWQSASVRNRLRSLVRHLKPRLQEQDIILDGIAPDVCFAAAHLERASQGNLPHWDLPVLLDFYFWANRQLRPGGRKLLIFPQPEGIFSCLPSLNGLGAGRIGN